MGAERVTGELRLHASAEAFIEATRDSWEQREAEFNLMLGVACAVRDARGTATQPRWFATMQRGDSAVAALMRTAPSGFVVGEDEPGEAAALAELVASTGEHRDSPSVVGSTAAARGFGAAWAHATGGVATLVMAQRILALTAVTPPPAAPGAARLANSNDADMLIDWLEAMELEASPESPTPRSALAARMRQRIEGGHVFVWVAEELVSMATLTRPTPNGVAVNAVYTPPELRGRGYASSCVAATSQRALASGKRLVCLYTDASNPTSNALYERIGYRFVCESEHWSFRP